MTKDTKIEQGADKRLLFITSTRIGDAVLSMGILRQLIDDNPGIKVTVACGPVAAPLFAAVPNLDRVIAMNKRPYAGHWFSLWSDCFETRWDIVVDLRRSLVSYGLCSKKRYRLPKLEGLTHRLDDMGKLIGKTDPVPLPKIWLADEHRNGAKKRYNKMTAHKILAVGPTANWRAKTWRIEHFIELVKRLTAPGGIMPNAPVAVFGGPNEREQALPLLQSIPEDKCIDLIGNTGLLSACACLEKAALYIGNDSGLMHMAAAMGTPTLGLFGPSRDEHYAPRGKLASFIRTPIPFDEIYPPDFDHRTADTLMDSLTVDMVEKAAKDLYRKAYPPAGMTASVDAPPATENW